MPVVIATNGYGIPVTVVTNGRGVPCTLVVAGKFGVPIIVKASGGLPIQYTP
jgi:hypothetical protein